MRFAAPRSSTSPRTKIVAAAAAGTTAAVIILTTHPAAYAAALAAVQSAVTCATTTACVAGTNSSSGPGVAGTSKTGIGTSGTSTSNVGVYGLSSASNGVGGTSTSGYGVSGYSSQSFGVQGVSPGVYGVVGISTTNFGVVAESKSGEGGLYGYTLGNGDGVIGAASVGAGVFGEASGGEGVWGQSSGSGLGVYGESQSGQGVYANSYTGIALNAYSAKGIGIRSDINGTGFSVVATTEGGGGGGDFEGERFGIIGRAQPSGYPLVLTDSSYNNVFYVSGTGDVYYHGNLQPFSRSASGAMIGAYTAKSAQPTVEDTGSAQLTAGVATVMLDSTFAAAVDQSTAYRVFVTPDGDTRGLYVALKTPRGFMVRETQGGRSNLTFDYRIVATGLGQVGKRMAFQSALAMPRAPIAPAATNIQLTHATLPKVVIGK